MDHVRLLSIQAGEHTTYTTSMEKLLKQAFISNRLKVYNGPLGVSDEQGQAKKEREGKQEEPKQGQEWQNTRKGKKERKRVRTCNCKLHHLVLWCHCRA